MSSDLIGGLDIGGTKVAAVVAGPDGPLARMTQATVKTGPVRSLAEQTLALLDAACAKAGISLSRLNTVGVSSCGPFVQLHGMLGLSAPNICGGLSDRPDPPNDWTAIPLEQVLRERFDRVVMANDCIAALTAERTFGAVRDELHCAYVTWSTGIGFGLCVDGHVLFGKHGNAGHAGHLLMDPASDIACGCGNRGDLEALISGSGLAYQAGRQVPELFAAARSGEPQARALVEQAAVWFGRALYNLTATLDLRTFVVGGSVWAHHGDWLQPIVHREIASRFPVLTDGVRIVPAALGSLVADIGALALVMPDSWIPGWRSSEPWRMLAAAGN